MIIMMMKIKGINKEVDPLLIGFAPRLISTEKLSWLDES